MGKGLKFSKLREPRMCALGNDLVDYYSVRETLMMQERKDA